MMQPIYPQILEEWWTQFVLRELGFASLFDCSRRIEKNIQTLSDAYTKQREFRTDLFKDPELLSAYGLFFFPQTYARTKFVFREILNRGWKPSGPVSILDLGSGAGAASFSIASEIQNEVSITAVDRSKPALSVMQKIASECLRKNCEIHEHDIWNWANREKKKYDVIVASFSLSETHVSLQQWTNTLLRLLNDSGIVLVLEPSLKETSENIELWRNEIAQKTSLYIWGPCLHRKECPLLMEGKYWCHEVRSWKPPESLAFMNRCLYREIHITKFSFLAFGKSPPAPLSVFAFRLISPVSKRKKQLVFSGCATDGMKHNFQISVRSLSLQNRHLIRKWERGDTLTDDGKGIHILESDNVYVVQNRFSPRHEVGNE
jgi:ribosomal protein RSM22 (predicted rRNA methylase)